MIPFIDIGMDVTEAGGRLFDFWSDDPVNAK